MNSNTSFAADAELGLATRHWTGGLRLTIGDEVVGFTTVDGTITDVAPEPGPGVIQISGPGEAWAPLFAPTPPPFVTVSTMVGDGESAGLPLTEPAPIH